MCYYITAILPLRADIDALAAIAHKYDRQLAPQAIDGVEMALRSGEGYFLTTAGHCDCGTSLGALNRGKKIGDVQEVDVKRLRSKGWSEAKISRWLDQKGHSSKGKRDLQRWHEFLTETLQSGLTPYIGIIVHFYSGPLTERIPIQKREVIEFSGLNLEQLGQLQEDIIYEFYPEPCT